MNLTTNMNLTGKRIYFYSHAQKHRSGNSLEGVDSIVKALGAEVSEALNETVDIYVLWDHTKTIDPKVQKLNANGANIVILQIYFRQFLKL